MSKTTAKSQKKKPFDKGQKSKLCGYAKSMFTAFADGKISPSDFNPSIIDISDGISFGTDIVRLSQKFYSKRNQFILLSAKMLKAKAAHEKTIASMCLKAP